MATLKMKFGVISADDHVQEAPDVWTNRMSKTKFGDDIPHIVDLPDGSQTWALGGSVQGFGGLARIAGVKARVRTWDEVPRSTYVASERLKILDQEELDASVLFPNIIGITNQNFQKEGSEEFRLACIRAYNDWLIETWAAASERFIPQCIVPIWPVETTVDEIRRAVGMGHRGVIFPSLPMHLRKVPHISGPEYDPLWSVCEELDVPVCLHAGASTKLQYSPSPKVKRALAGALDAVTRPVSSVFVLSLYSFSRIFLRHPGLRVVFAESALSWAMLYMEWADHQFEHDGLAREGYDLKPSEMFHRQCFLTSWFDQVAPFVSYVGADHILWSTNFPLATSTWPRTGETLDRCFRGVSKEVRESVLWRNAARLYRL